MRISLSKDEARRFLVSRHGLGKRRPANHLQQVAEEDGAIQYDPINIVGNNSDLVLHARLEGYHEGQFQEYVNDTKSFFEAYHHKSTFRPVSQYGELTRVREWVYNHEGAPMRKKYRRYWNEIVKRVTNEGPVCSADVDEGERIVGHWGTKTSLARTLLDVMAQSGILVVGYRKGNVKHYDLPERVYSNKDRRDPFKTEDDCFKKLIERRVFHLGLASDKEAMAEIATIVKDIKKKKRYVESLVEEGMVLPVNVAQIKQRLLIHRQHLRLLEKPFESDGQYRFLAPLDSFLIDRRLIEALFDFSYTWEAYQPKSKRKYGYYVLPMLRGDNLVGRIELRKTTKGIAKIGLWPERDHKIESALLNEALQCHAHFLRLKSE